jgi:hypothetical protein
MGNNMSSDPTASTALAREEPPLPKAEDIHLIVCGKLPLRPIDQRSTLSTKARKLK